MTRPVRLAALVVVAACAAAHAQIPSPEAHFGHRMGADRTLLEWDAVVSFFRKLEASSNRIRVTELGKSTEGRPFIAAIVASPATLQSLDRYQEIQKRLADPRVTTPTEAQRLWTEGKAVVLITCSIHSTEVASTATAVEFAHKLVTDRSGKFQSILENTIVLLVPSLNPDGVDLVTRWYRGTVGTPFEGSQPPELYHKYAGHDNNRDWYMFTQSETRLTVDRLHNAWHPQIVYDLHQQGVYSSRIFVPPWMDPIDPNVDPILIQLCNAFGSGIAADLTLAGKTGVAINALYDFWTPARHYQSYHGGLRILSETASARLASPVRIAPEELNTSALGYSPRAATWNHLEPWTGGVWRQRDIVDYQLITLESLLYQAALRREDLLRAFYRIGERAIARTNPYAFVIPAVQRDPGALRVLLETLAFGQVEIQSAEGEFQANRQTYPAGTYVIRMQQPYGSFAKTLLERQRYPDVRQFTGGPPRKPYDVTAHTLPLLMGVAVDTASEPFEVKLRTVTSFSPPTRDAAPHDAAADGVAGKLSGADLSGADLSAADSDSWRKVTQAWAAGLHVSRDLTSGAFRVSRSAPSTARADGGLGDTVRTVVRPRIAIYKSWVPSIDAGWTRWLLERFGFAYENADNRVIVGSDLRSRYDVLVVPSQRSGSIHNGHSSLAMPEQFVGGLGDAGVGAIRSFAEAGGTVVFLNESSEWAIEHLNLGVRDALAGVSDTEFYAPGSLLNVRSQPHPLTLGLPNRYSVWFENGPAFELHPAKDGAATPVTFDDSAVLASGWLLGEKRIARRAAVVQVPVGSGRVVLFGIRPQYRGQSYLTFKLFFNSLLLGSYL